MKFNYLFSVLAITGVMMMTTVEADANVMSIRSLFNIKNSFCTIKTNGVVGMDNRRSALHGRGGGISSTNALLFLENGSNTIGIEIGSLGWFSRNAISDEERKRFNPLASCKLDLVRNDHGVRTTLTTIEIKINEAGIPESIQNNNKIIGHKMKTEQAISGHIDHDFFNPYYFPKEMEVYSFEQVINLQGIPSWPWINATPYDGSKEQLELLKNSYNELADILKSKNRKKLMESHKIALKSWAIATGDTPDEILDSQYSQKELESGKFNILPINWSDYEIRSMNEGRIVQLYNKSKPTYSPLTYYYTNDKGVRFMGSIAPMFSLINGKFVVVI